MAVSTLNTDGAADPINCPKVNFNLTFFQTAASQATVPLSGLKTTPLTPVDDSNPFAVTVAILGFNRSSARYQLFGNITLASKANSTGLLDTRPLRMVIDVKRTVAGVTVDPACHFCRTVPGSVCCNDLVELTYLPNPVPGESWRVISTSPDEEIFPLDRFLARALNPPRLP